MNKLEELENEYYKFDVQTGKKLLPSFINNAVAICLACSEEYAPFASLVVRSLVEHSCKNKKYDILVLTTDITRNTQVILKSCLSNCKNITLRFVYVNSYIDNMSFFTWAHFTKNTYFRLLIPDIFSQYEKVLYLDSDVIICNDVMKLLEMDISSYYLGACLDTHVVSYCYQANRTDRTYNQKVLGLTDPYCYFQMGVVLFNISKINEDFPSGFLIGLTQKNTFKWLDQDLLNKVFAGKIKKISNKWNVMIANNLPLCDECFLPPLLRKEYMDARKNPYIIHFIGKSMPCFRKKCDMSMYWWKIARLSPFYEYFLMELSYHAASWYYTENILQRKISWKIYFCYEWYRFLSHCCWGKTRDKFTNKKLQLRQKIK